MYVHIIGWCKIEMWDICTSIWVSRKDIIVQWNLLYMKPSKDNMQEKSEYESLYDSAGNEGYMVCILSRRKSSIADLIGIILCYLKMFLLFFYWHWVLSTNNFLFLLIMPVNSGSTKVNIKGVKKKKPINVGHDILVLYGDPVNFCQSWISACC